jgi:hypothetical protein
MGVKRGLSYDRNVDRGPLRKGRWGRDVYFDLTKEVTERDRICIMRSFEIYTIFAKYY